MSKNILLVGQESTLSFKIIDLCFKEGCKFIALSPTPIKNIETVNWSKQSYLSCKTAFRELTRKEAFPSQIMIFFGKQYSETFLEHTNSMVDEIVDGELKSYVYLIQELYKYIEKNDLSVNIHFVCEKPYDAKYLLSSATTVALKTYIEAIMEKNINSKIYMAGYECSNDDGGFADFIVKNVMETSPRRQNNWTSYPKGIKLFGIK